MGTERFSNDINRVPEVTLLLWPDGTASWETLTNEYGATEWPSS